MNKQFVCELNNWLTHLHNWLSRNILILIILLFYFSTILIVPVMTPVPISDDWIYTRSVEIFIELNIIKILDISVVTQVFQIIWGALFYKVLGGSNIFGVLRVSTITLVALSGVFLYLLLQLLEINRHLSAIGVAIYLFNPLMFVLSYTFMTDSHFTAIFIICMYFYTMGFKKMSLGYLFIGSIFAGISFLIRQSGIFILISVLMFVLFTMKYQSAKYRFQLVFSGLAIPVLTITLYYYWIYNFHGIPKWQGGYLNNILSLSIGETLWLLIRLTFIEVMYIGFFLIPLSFPLIPFLPRIISNMSHKKLFWGIFVLFLLVFTFFTGIGLRMPYVPHFLNRAGLGPNDLVISRSPLVTRDVLIWFTIICAISCVLLLSVILHSGIKNIGSHIFLIYTFGIWQVVGVVIPSISFRKWKVDGHGAPSLDRYLLVLLPIAIIIIMWSLNKMRLNYYLVFSITVILAIFAIAGTRDALLFHHSTWKLAERANSLGIPNIYLDGGGTWDGYHLYEYSLANDISVQTPEYELIGVNTDALVTNAIPPWWINLWAPATNSKYIILGYQIDGFTTVSQIELNLWLQKEREILYLQERP